MQLSSILCLYVVLLNYSLNLSVSTRLVFYFKHQVPYRDEEKRLLHPDWIHLQKEVKSIVYSTDKVINNTVPLNLRKGFKNL